MKFGSKEISLLWDRLEDVHIERIKQTATRLVLAGVDDVRLVIRYAQLLSDLGLLSSQVSSVSQVLDVLEPDSLGQEETNKGRDNGDDGSSKDLLEHDVFESLDETLTDGISQGELLSMGNIAVRDQTPVELI